MVVSRCERNNDVLKLWTSVVTTGAHTHTHTHHPSIHHPSDAQEVHTRTTTPCKLDSVCMSQRHGQSFEVQVSVPFGTEQVCVEGHASSLRERTRERERERERERIQGGQSILLTSLSIFFSSFLFRLLLRVLENMAGGQHGWVVPNR